MLFPQAQAHALLVQALMPVLVLVLLLVLLLPMPRH
jgi:hypothetical protein